MTHLITARPEEVGLNQAALDNLSAALTGRVARGHVPGAVALIARHGKVAYHEAFGRQDPASDRPMATNSIFRIYSMTKSIVSVAIMMLWEEGKLLVGDPVGKYIPAFDRTSVGLEHAPLAGPITIQDLPRHTSGLAYEFRGTGPIQQAYLDAGTNSPKQTNAEQAETLARLPLMHQPGTPSRNTAAPPTCWGDGSKSFPARP